jgi:hypothetical protein
MLTTYVSTALHQKVEYYSYSNINKDKEGNEATEEFKTSKWASSAQTTTRRYQIGAETEVTHPVKIVELRESSET